MLKIPEIDAEDMRRVALLRPSSQQEDEISASERHARLRLLRQVMRFGLVGGLNTLIDILVLNALLLLWPTTSVLLILAYNALAYAAGASNSFVCNKYWTFKQRQPISRRELMRFTLTTLLGMALNSAMLWLAGLALHSLQINATLWTNASKILAISATMLVSYLGMRLWVFASKGQHAPANLALDAPTDIARRATLPLHYVLQYDTAQHAIRERFTSKSLPDFPPAVQMQDATHHVERKGTAQYVTYEQGADLPKRYSLSVVLPAYNEEEAIASTIVTALDVLDSWHIESEILVVNDGSSDRTSTIVAELARLHPQIHLIDHTSNQGYGAALVSGFQAATKELTFFMDSDGQFDIRALRSFFPFIERYDAVLGYRINRQDSWMRKFNAWGWKVVVSVALGIRVRDLDCAFKLFHTRFLHEYPLETRGAMINAELLYRLKQGSFTWREVGVPHLPRVGGRATGAHPRVIMRALRDLFVYTRRWQRAEKSRDQQKNISHHQHV